MATRSKMDNSIIEFFSVGKNYPNNPLPSLTNVSFQVSEGEFFVIVGPSGCGKSTVLKIIAGLEDVTSGKVNKPADVSMVFQSGALLPWMSVYENVAIGLRAKGESEAKVAQTSLKFLEMTGLSQFVEKYPRD